MGRKISILSSSTPSHHGIGVSKPGVLSQITLDVRSWTVLSIRSFLFPSFWSYRFCKTDGLHLPGPLSHGVQWPSSHDIERPLSRACSRDVEPHLLRLILEVWSWSVRERFETDFAERAFGRQKFTWIRCRGGTNGAMGITSSSKASLAAIVAGLHQLGPEAAKTSPKLHIEVKHSNR